MTKADEAKAQLVIVTGLLVLHFVFKKAQPYFLYAAITVGIICIAIPVAGALIVKGWYKLAEVLGAINGKVLLSLVFYVVLFPVAMIARLSKKNPLALKRETGRSVFVERNHKYEAKDFDQVW